MAVSFVFFILVLAPAVAAFLAERALSPRPTIRPDFCIGTRVIYRREEVSTRPTPGARDIRPAERGEFYYYNIINYLRVIEVLDDGRIVAATRNQQRLCFWPDDSSLRKARLTERLRYRLSRDPFS